MFYVIEPALETYKIEPRLVLFKRGCSAQSTHGIVVVSLQRMNTIIFQDLSADGRRTCLHEFHEARKAAYFKPASLRYVYLGLISIYLLEKPRADLRIGLSGKRNLLYLCLILLFCYLTKKKHYLKRT